MSDFPPVPMVDISDPELVFFPYRFVLDFRGHGHRAQDEIRLWVRENYGDDAVLVTSNQFWFLDPTIATAFKLRWHAGAPA